MTTMRARLVNCQQASTWLRDAYAQLKPYLLAGKVFRITIQEDTRTLEQNAKFHAICSDFGKARLPWAGKPRASAQWKVLLVSGHSVATNEGSEIIPGLESEFVNIRESTALMSVKRSSSLIEYSLAFGAEKGVVFSRDEVTA